MVAGSEQPGIPDGKRRRLEWKIPATRPRVRTYSLTTTTTTTRTTCCEHILGASCTMATTYRDGCEIYDTWSTFLVRLPLFNTTYRGDSDWAMFAVSILSAMP